MVLFLIILFRLVIVIWPRCLCCHCVLFAWSTYEMFAVVSGVIVFPLMLYTFWYCVAVKTGLFLLKKVGYCKQKWTFIASDNVLLIENKIQCSSGVYSTSVSVLLVCLLFASNFINLVPFFLHIWCCGLVWF
jgi:hypothetical protein